MSNGYDLDGVLAEAPPPARKAWRHMKGPERAARRSFLIAWYRRARPLITPRCKSFVVITARKDEPLIRSVTEAWLQKHYPGKCIRLYMLKEARNIENNVRFKSEVIRKEKLRSFAEDNRRVVRELRKVCTAQIFYFNGVVMEAE